MPIKFIHSIHHRMGFLARLLAARAPCPCLSGRRFQSCCGWVRHHVFESTHPSFNDVTLPISSELNILCGNLSGRKLLCAQYAIQAYGECLQRLISRFMELRSTCRALQPDPHRPDEYVQRLQVALVDRTEAFFQQYYAAMSNFAV